MALTRRSLLIGTASAGAAALALHSPVAHLLGLAQQPQRPTPSGRAVSVLDFGARREGRSNDRAAIQAAIDALASSGGGTVLLPAGTYVVSRAGKSAVAITLKSGITLQGEGTASVLKLQDGSGGHLINVARETNCAVRNMVLDGNRDRQPFTGHALRSGGVDGLLLENLTIRNAFHYGIGLQGGTNRNVTINGVLIENTGGDGIDIKNKSDDNAAVLITNVTVRRWGLRRDRHRQAAIDCRGPVRLSDIRVSEPGAEDAVGVRMRQGELGDPNGLGAHHANLDGFDIRMGEARALIGINVVARYVEIVNGDVSGGFRGLMVMDNDFRGTGIRVSGCSDIGILIDAHGSSLNGDRAVLSNCVVTGCGGNGIEVEADQADILGCVSRNNGRHGLLLTDTSNGTRVVGGDFSGNRAGPISSRGTNSHIAALAV